MILSSKTAERIQRELQEYLRQGRCTYISVNETAGRVETFTTSHNLKSGGWTDGSKEDIRIFRHEDERVWIGFSIADFFFSLQEGEEITVSRSDGVRIRHVAPCGDRRLDWFKLELPPGDGE